MADTARTCPVCGNAYVPAQPRRYRCNACNSASAKRWYARKKAGLPSLKLENTPDNLREKVIEAATGCWEFQGLLDKDGYGTLSYLGKRSAAHRAFYRAFVGRIPAEFEIDHLCRNRRCCNPAHLEAVTREENQRRSLINRAPRPAPTHCRRGHRLDDANVSTARGRRDCLQCGRERTRAYQNRQRETEHSL